MCAYYPVTESSLLEISGVGIRKLENYGSIFLSIIKSYCLRKNITPGKRKNTRRRERRSRIEKPKYILIGESFNDGSSINDLADEHNIKTQTVVSNLSRYMNEGNKIRKDGLEELLTINKEVRKIIFDAFDNEGTVTLKNIFEKFEEKISYQDLHILRILYIIDKQKQLNK
jgi:ATP-dependent DNA helicase RecQ